MAKVREFKDIFLITEDHVSLSFIIIMPSSTFVVYYRGQDMKN